MIERSRRGAYDELYTPTATLIPLMPYLPEGIIWEAAPGDLRLVKQLEASGRTVAWERQDYFEWQPDEWDLMVTNPPFSKKASWLRRANELAKPFALLLPVTALGSRECQLQLDECQVLFLPRRIDFTGGGAPWFSVAWYTRGFRLPSQLYFVKDMK